MDRQFLGSVRKIPKLVPQVYQGFIEPPVRVEYAPIVDVQSLDGAFIYPQFPQLGFFPSVSI